MITKQELLEDAKRLIETYGEPTVAADFAKKVEEYLTEEWNITPVYTIGEYTPTLSIEDLPRLSYSYGIETAKGKKNE